MRYFLGVMLFVVGMLIIDWNMTENENHTVFFGTLGYTIVAVGTGIFASNF